MSQHHAPSRAGAIHGFIHGRDPLTAARTARKMAALGAEAKAEGADFPAVWRALGGVQAQVLIADAGVWFAGTRPLPALPSEGNWVAVGAWRGHDFAAKAWAQALACCGGDLSRLRWWHRRPPRPPALLMSPLVAQRCSEGPAPHDFDSAWRALRRSGCRVVHLPELDAYSAPKLRVLQVVTSIQVGGAERVALDLATALPEHGVAAKVVVLGRPLREAFPAPAGMVDLSHLRNDPQVRAEAIRQVALEFGADLVHGHLLRASEVRAIRAAGLPVVLHVHNLPRGWPADYRTLQPGDVSLVVACSQAVERAVQDALPALPVRTIWNGIAPRTAPAKRAESGRPFTVVTLANPRAQKRLERIPAIASATAQAMAPRAVRFVIGGATTPHSDDSAAALRSLEEALEVQGAHQLVERPGLVSDPFTLLRDADVLLSVSAYEGLSLAHLEALAAGVAVVATDVGGAREMAAHSEAVTLLPVEAPDGDFVRALTHLPPVEAQLPPSFTRHAMAGRAHWLYSTLLYSPKTLRPQGLWLIANNFSTGGAQSSARRLLVELKQRGLHVRAAVIQEDPENPTPGRQALLDAGITVVAIPPGPGVATEHSVQALLHHLQTDPSEAVFFWNLITSWKVLLADALPQARIFDISPGEMYFTALDRFFAKPPTGLPYRCPTAYGARLAGAVVKYAAEQEQAAGRLGSAVHVIPNGVPLFPPPPRRGNSCLVLGTAARLSPDKKLGDLLAALRLAAPRLPEFVLRVAGGPERDFPEHAAELRHLAQGLPVEWLGNVHDMTPFLHALDLFLMISEPAGCPNAILEAMAAGLPVIATDYGGASEQVIDGATGRLTARGDHAAFAEAVVQLAGDPARRAIMGTAAQKRIEQEFSLARMADRYAALISAETGR